MAASDGQARRSSALERWRSRLTSAAALVAFLGGLVLVAAALFTVSSVIGGAIAQPFLGDSEVVELAAGIAVASFMPYCQMKGGHVAITLFTDGAPAWVLRSLETLAALIAAVIVALLTWRLIDGGFSAFDRQRASMFLQLPTWWGYALASVPMLLWVVTAVFCLVEQVVQGRPADAGDQASL